MHHCKIIIQEAHRVIQYHSVQKVWKFILADDKRFYHVLNVF